MIRSMLIGLDGSSYSGVAIELGLQWSKKSGALLVGVGITDESMICQPEAVPLGGGAYKASRE